MSMFNGMLGNASAMTEANVRADFGKLLSDSEQVTAGYKLVRDVIILTDRRIIQVDKQGVTGRKVEYHSIPYKSITHFSVETTGHFDLEAELVLWLSGMNEPIKIAFSKGVDVYALQARLTNLICR